MSNDGEQRQVKQVSTRASAARSDGLLPLAAAPAIVAVPRADAAQLDAALTIVTLPPGNATFRALPETARWQELHAREPARAGSVRTTVLANPRHTLAVLGYLDANASAFERLALAGRMLRETAARQPQQVALAAPGPRAAGRAALEALLAATLAHAFPLPSFRSQCTPSGTYAASGCSMATVWIRATQLRAPAAPTSCAG